MSSRISILQTTRQLKEAGPVLTDLLSIGSVNGGVTYFHLFSRGVHSRFVLFLIALQRVKGRDERLTVVVAAAPPWH